MQMKLAFMGLGVMGYPMAGHLARAGHDVAVYNRTASKAEAWCREYGGVRRETPAEAAAGADLAFICVGNDDDVREVAESPHGALEGLKTGAILVDHTTASAGLARELEQRATARGLGFLDAPVSGGQAGAESGRLTVLVGLAEGLSFAVRAGLDPSQVAAVLSKGAAQSWQLENRARTMIEGKFDFGFAVDWMRKDLAIGLEEARRNGSALPVAALVDQLYQRVQARGGSRWDTSSLIQLLTAP
jgi:3-hydroxyisobutyrate dehydrogenase